MKRILLVTPDKGREVLKLSGVQYGTPPGLPPLELATLAALTPPDFEVDIWDERIRGTITPSTDLGAKYDLMGATGYLSHVPRMLQLCHEFRRRGTMTVVGGPAVSGTPERFRNVADVVFLGEAELTWPKFLAEWPEGRHQREYRQVQRPDITLSPRPRWDSMGDLSKSYSLGAVQTTRGCPFDCEFCDVIHLFGRQPRHKPVETVLEEIAALEKRGIRRIFFCDDDFIARPKYTKELLKALIPLNNSFSQPMGFVTQLTITVAHDEELLELMAEANFWQLHIGIESPRQASLREVHKLQNTRSDMAEDVRRVQSYGILVKALMIVGFDNDDVTIFDETFEFLQRAQVPIATISILQAWPGTPLYARLQRDRRILNMELDDLYALESGSLSNIIPGGMSRIELFRGYVDLETRHRNWKNFGERMKELIRGVKRVPSNVAKLGTPDPARAAAFQQMVGMLDDEARAVIMELYKETMEHCPWMLPKIASRVLFQVGLSQSLPRLKERIQKTIDTESAPGYTYDILRTLPPIPAELKKVHREVFPTSYDWLVSGLTDVKLVPEGLIRVWKDFVVRWGPTFQKFEDYHHEHLRELCSRVVEQGNAGRFANSRAFAQTDGLTGVQIRRLADEVLFSVEQDLRGGPSPQLVPLGVN
jgi:radical SAM superfamily enzyme YgiQ (UPF0313 family)